MSRVILPRVQLIDWTRRFRDEAERLSRRGALLCPKDEDEYLSMLRWIIARGEERDLELIEVSRRIGRFHSQEAERLIRKAPYRIRARNLSPRDLGRYVSGELKYPGPLDFVAHQSARLIKQVNSMNPEASEEWLMAHLRAADTIARRVQLIRPRTEQEMLQPHIKQELQQAIYWAAACGDEADAQLLDALTSSNMLDAFSPSERQAFEQVADRAKESIRNRLEAARLMDEVLKPAREPAITVVTNALRLGMRVRGTAAPRGKIDKPAEARVALDEARRSQAARLLRSRNQDLRKQVALMLGEWGGEPEAQMLANSLREDLRQEADAPFARYCVAALKNIGGQTAAHALCDAVEHGPEAIQLAALNAIEELVTGGSEVYGEGTPHFDPPRGRYAKGEPPAPGTERITETLEKMMHSQSQAVRERSKELLYHVLL